MFESIKKRKLDNLADSVRAYLEEHYKEPQVRKRESVVEYRQEYWERYSRVGGEKKSGLKLSEPKAQYQRADYTQEQPSAPPFGDKVDSAPSSDTSFSIDDTDDTVQFSRRDSAPRFSLRDNYDSDTVQLAMRSLTASSSPVCTSRTLDEIMNMSFVEKMLEHINRKHLRDSDVYKAAQIDRRLFSKIVSDSAYKPAKDTCIALCLAMKLTLAEANDLLSRAGYTFSHSNKRDVILEYFFRERVYNLNDVNEILCRLDQKILGR